MANDHESVMGVGGLNIMDDAGLDRAFIDLTSSLPSRAAVSFTEHEQRLLDLHDQLKELRLEYALLEAQQRIPQESMKEIADEEAEKQIKKLERECLEARAAYLLKNSVVDNVLAVDPILKAIHAGAGGDPMERALQPLIDRRDVLSMAHANLSHTLQQVSTQTTMVEVENINCMRRNQDLAKELLNLTDQLKAQIKPDQIENEELRSQLQTLEEESREAKRRRRIMKSLISAVIAGSGVDWAHDDDLRELVLDDED